MTDQTFEAHVSMQEIEQNLHPSLLDPHEYKMIRLQFDFDPDRQKVTVVRVMLRSSRSGRVREFEFEKVSFPDCGELRLFSPHGTGVYVVDIGYRQWEGLRFEVLADYEEAPVLFWASTVIELTGGDLS